MKVKGMANNIANGQSHKNKKRETQIDFHNYYHDVRRSMMTTLHSF